MALGTEIALIKALGGGSGSLPPITASDNGKVLTANSGVWGAQEPIGKKFIVTLTPTAQDFSGTMDKTVAEINAAYEAGQEIVLRVMVSSGVYYDFATTVSYVGAHAYPQHVCMGVVDDKLILFWTDTDLPENTTYYTTLYALTHAT